jgi:hypothetical protein
MSKRQNGFATHRREQRFTEPVKFAVVAYDGVMDVFACCQYEAVGIATEDPNLREYYPLCFDGYVFACHQDQSDNHNEDTYSGFPHPDDDYNDEEYLAHHCL